MAGHVVRDLSVGANSGSVLWDGLDQGGQAAPAGVYVYKIRNGANIFTGRMVLER